MLSNLYQKALYINKNNNFDIIRLVLAGIVCLVHMSELTNFKD